MAQLQSHTYLQAPLNALQQLLQAIDDILYALSTTCVSFSPPLDV